MKKRLFALFIFCAFAMLIFAQSSGDTLVFKGKYYTYVISKGSIFSFIYRPEFRNTNVLVFPGTLEENTWYKIKGLNKRVDWEVKPILQPYGKELGKIGINFKTDFEGNIFDVDFYFNRKDCESCLPFMEAFEEAAHAIMENIHVDIIVSSEGAKHIPEYDGILMLPVYIDFNDKK
jgi:hypothetical protein